MVQSGRNIIIFVLDCCSSVTLLPLLPHFSPLPHQQISVALRFNKVWNKIQPCCFHFESIQNMPFNTIHDTSKNSLWHLFSHLLKSSNNPVKYEWCGLLLRSGSFLVGFLKLNSASLSLIRNVLEQITMLLRSLTTHLRFSAVCLFVQVERPATHFCFTTAGLNTTHRFVKWRARKS